MHIVPSTIVIQAFYVYITSNHNAFIYPDIVTYSISIVIWANKRPYSHTNVVTVILGAISYPSEFPITRTIAPTSMPTTDIPTVDPTPRPV